MFILVILQCTLYNVHCTVYIFLFVKFTDFHLPPDILGMFSSCWYPQCWCHQAELGTRQHCRENVTMHFGFWLWHYSMSIFVVSTPFRHWGLHIFRRFSCLWSSFILLSHQGQWLPSNCNAPLYMNTCTAEDYLLSRGWSERPLDTLSFKRTEGTNVQYVLHIHVQNSTVVPIRTHP